MTSDPLPPRRNLQPVEDADTIRYPAMRPEERIVYDALREAQRGMHWLDNFVICPQTWCELRTMRIRTDFVVIMRSTLAVEVDGSSHVRRRAADTSRDHCCEDHNLPVLRIPIEDVYDPTLLADWVERIVSRVRRYRPMPGAA
jgi:very-short-patch-repair endonuclease